MLGFFLLTGMYSFVYVYSKVVISIMFQLICATAGEYLI